MSTIVQVLWGIHEVRILLGLTMLIGVATLVWQLMHRRPWIPPVGLVLSVGVVAALTLYSPAVPGLTRPRFSDCWSGFDVHRLLSDALLTPSGQANVALFVPLGTFLFLVWRRAVTAAAMILGTTLLIELAQGLVIGGHDCSIADLVANTTGGWAGIALTAAGVRAAAQRATSPAPPTGRLNR